MSWMTAHPDAIRRAHSFFGPGQNQAAPWKHPV